MALRRSLEVGIPRRRLARLPSLRGVPFVLDAVALLAVVGLSGLHPVAVIWAVAAFCLLNADAARAYRLDPRVGHELGWLLVRLATPLLALSVAAAAGVPGVRDLDRELAATWAAGLVIPARALAYALVRAAKVRGLVWERTLIVGGGALGVELAGILERHPEYGLRPIGFLDRDPLPDLPLPVLGEPKDLPRAVEELEVRRVIVAFGGPTDRETAVALRALEALPVEVHVVPRFFELGSVPAGAADDVRGIPLVHLPRPTTRLPADLVKRAFDLAAAALLLVLTAPVCLGAALAVRLSSPGPILFRQTRVGRGGRPFEILKFRTMVVNDGADTAWAAEDGHVTGVGRWLRRLSIDELPQLINVLRGEMSLVGPRPERPYFVERFSAEVPGYRDRLRVRGGITGLAQVCGRDRSLDGIPERARLDNRYIDTWTLWGDVLILFRTLRLMFRGDAP
ncbi:MAG TPA: sugar transferase [Actinomycetota bacterium]|nr:sugar transferase [Actinomycetota bacterium]